MLVDETFVRVTDYIPQWYEIDKELEAKGVSRKGYQQNYVNTEVDETEGREERPLTEYESIEPNFGSNAKAKEKKQQSRSLRKCSGRWQSVTAKKMRF